MYGFKMGGEMFTGKCVGLFFPQRLVVTWKVLPGEVVVADMIMEFKKILDMHMDMEG